MTWTVAATGYWDRHVIDLVSRHVAPQTLVLDIGASLGLWAVPLGRLARSGGGLLWCFEPNPDNIPWLSLNIERNGLADVAEVQAVALGARAGTAHLTHVEHGGGNGALEDNRSQGSVAVQVKRLDDLELSRAVSFIKLDVEGFELRVLQGARKVIERDRPVIFGEFNAEWMNVRGENVPDYLRSLIPLGYEVFTIDERRSAVWRPKDVASVRRLHPPFASGVENLLLVPPAEPRPSLGPEVPRGAL